MASKIYRYISRMAAAVILATTVACTSSIESELAALTARISNLETQVSAINDGITSLNTLVKALQGNDYIRSVQPTSAGCVVVFQSGTVITLKSGTNGYTPIMGIRYDSALGYYCWTVKMGSAQPTWLLDSYGRKVTAETIIPMLRIFEGFWQVTYDNGAHWTTLFEAIGPEGTSFFRDIDMSDPYYVRFTLTNGTIVTVPTQKGFEELMDLCDEINGNIGSYSSIMTDASFGLFLARCTEIVEDGEVVGYRIQMGDGRIFTIRNGRDVTKSVDIGIAADSEGGELFWTVRYGDDVEATWLLVDGERVPASPLDRQPTVGIRQEEGVFYFTVGMTGSDQWTWMRDAEGNRIKAQAEVQFNFFESAEVDADFVTLTLLDGSKLSLRRTSERRLDFEVPQSDGFYGDSIFRYSVVVSEELASRTAPYADYQQYAASLDLAFRAMMMENGTVAVEADPAFTVETLSYDEATGTGRYRYTCTYSLLFHTAKKIAVPGQTRVALFLSWGEFNSMKVWTVENRELDPVPVPGEDPDPIFDPE